MGGWVRGREGGGEGGGWGRAEGGQGGREGGGAGLLITTRHHWGEGGVATNWRQRIFLIGRRPGRAQSFGGGVDPPPPRPLKGALRRGEGVG